MFLSNQKQAFRVFLNVKHHFLFDISDSYWHFKDLQARKYHGEICSISAFEVHVRPVLSNEKLWFRGKKFLILHTVY